jgi:ribosome hibernation promoting factor
MKITYTGLEEKFPPKLREKFEAKLQKLSKMLDRKGERDIHVIVKQERFLHHVEITLNAFDHSMIGDGSDADLFTALCSAAEKLEKQVLKLREKWRDTHRHKETPVEIEEVDTTVSAEKPARVVFRVNNGNGRKPMTLEEAMLEIGDRDYLTYSDAKTDRPMILMRRPDGHFDLIES